MELLAVIHKGFRRYAHEEFGQKSCASRGNGFVYNLTSS
jgi:hypothetical protein